METPKIGDRVKINVHADCHGEFKHHGIRPFIQDQIGIVKSYDRATEDHPWYVVCTATPLRGYFLSLIHI